VKDRDATLAMVFTMPSMGAAVMGDAWHAIILIVRMRKMRATTGALVASNSDANFCHQSQSMFFR